MSGAVSADMMIAGILRVTSGTSISTKEGQTTSQAGFYTHTRSCAHYACAAPDNDRVLWPVCGPKGEDGCRVPHSCSLIVQSHRMSGPSRSDPFLVPAYKKCPSRSPDTFDN